MQKRKIATTAMALVVAVGATIGGTFAYLTANDQVDNVLTIGDVSIELTEPNYDEDQAVDMVPNQTIAKDPTVKNDGVNDAVIFLHVTMPKATFTPVSADGTKGTVGEYEVFEIGALGAGWVDLGDGYYGYNTALAKDASTSALFSEVSVANFVEDISLNNSTQHILVDAYAIQADAIEGISTAGTMNATTLQSILDIYLNQNA